MQKVIELSNINLVSSDNKYILKNINLDINNTDCIVISGNNGAGKTSLLKISNGLIKPTNGIVKIFEKELNNNTKKLIGYIPQTNNIQTNLPISVRQVIEIGVTARQGIFKTISKQDKNLIGNIAKQLDIFDLLNTPIGLLSGGQIQKVSIARALVQKAKIIMLDEPLSNLDQKSQLTLINTIENIHKENDVTILMVTHNLELLPKCCNKKIVMKDGMIEILE